MTTLEAMPKSHKSFQEMFASQFSPIVDMSHNVGRVDHSLPALRQQPLSLLSSAFCGFAVGIVLLWIVVWLFLTVKQSWTFKLRVTVGRAAVR